MSREILSSSAMNTIAKCPKDYYYRYELGLRPIEDATALQFGTAWHDGMQARWMGKSYEDAFIAAMKTAKGLEESMVSALSGLLAGYYRHWGECKEQGTVRPEIEFRHPIEHSLTFDSAGKIDCLIENNGKVKIVEHKTTGMEISEGSQYWDRLRYNPQLFQYYLGAQALGHEIETVIYDVTRKPTIHVKGSVSCLDSEGRKIVLDQNANRVFKGNGEPRMSADAKLGYVFQTRPETFEEYAERLYNDTIKRPEFYFQRREVPILLQDIEAFIDERIERGKQILHYRARERKVGATGWPRNVGFFTCNTCAYAGFCLQGIPVDVRNPPPGFEVKRKHVELTEVTQQ